jgi:Fe-S-cluster-containing dehydrogenase component
MCYDRTSTGKRPMCATVCPSQALFFGTAEQIAQLRPMSEPVNTFQFGRQTISTRVSLMVPRQIATRPPRVDVTAAMNETDGSGAIQLKILADPFGEVEI